MVTLAAGAAGAATRGGAEPVAGFYEDALARFNKGEYRAAIIQLKNAIQRDPKDLAARILIARAYLKLENGASAEKELNLARRHGADESFFLVPLGRAFLLQGKYDKVLDRLRTGSGDHDREADILNLRGQAHLAKRSLGAAEEAFAKAIRLRADEAAPYIGQARVRLGRGEATAAGGKASKARSLESARPSVQQAGPQRWLRVQSQRRRLRRHRQRPVRQGGIHPGRRCLRQYQEWCRCRRRHSGQLRHLAPIQPGSRVRHNRCRRHGRLPRSRHATGWVREVQYEFELDGSRFASGTGFDLADLSAVTLHVSPNLLSGDNKVRACGLSDFSTVGGVLCTTSPPTGPPASGVPEPMSTALFGFGLLSLWLVRRRQMVLVRAAK